jgi:hypothetical protein
MTASTRTVTLSRVITSCGGTFMATVWRLTLTIRSMPNGRMKKSPGPLGRVTTRPSRKTMPRSYSWTTRTPEISAITTRMTNPIRTTMATVLT